MPLSKTSSVRNRFIFLTRWPKAPVETFQSSLAIVKAIDYCLQYDGKALLQKTTHIYVIKDREIKLDLTRNFIPSKSHST